ncbi:venom serine protease-like [Leptinotarsa decemlineata]|uniref:venom serine protease-like n=1 Tax=Leptinotarsa decemlineata TaxID=7539 RepID=UPI003D309219
MGFIKTTLMVLVGFLNLLGPALLVEAATCEFRQDLVMGQEYYIYNREYYGNYTPSTYCTWYQQSEPGTRIVVSCEDIAIPSSTNCVGDKLAISLNGDLNFRDAKNYCGTGSVSLVTNGNSLAVGLFATYNSKGGRFICTLTAIQNPDVTTTPTPPSVCDCGLKQTLRIVGGNETLVNEFPSMAALVDVQVVDVICGGSIISNRYIVTAAHCLLNVQRENLGILVGDHSISSGTDTVGAALYKVSAWEMHPNFDAKSLVNDIALLRTTTDIRFGQHVGPVCLPFRYTTFSFLGQTLTAAGWGQVFYTGPKSDVLLKVDLGVTSNEWCAQENSGNVITGGQICTFAPGKDACQSDSGGPLFWMDTATRRLQLVGVISYGLGCATARPGINTRVTSYVSWIVSRTTDATYCIK